MSSKKCADSEVKPFGKVTLRHIKPMNFAQEQMMSSYYSGLNLAAIGSAGSGKTFIASYLALNDIFSKTKQKIVIIRSAVASREQGFLPGTQEEKNEIYTLPYRQIFADLCGNKTAWDELQSREIVEFCTTSYIRGLTFDNSVIILDEIQNLNLHEIFSVFTRIGENTQVIAVGDGKQTDLVEKKSDRSGFNEFLRIVQHMSGDFDLINFTKADIVRSGFVRRWVEAVEDLGLL